MKNTKKSTLLFTVLIAAAITLHGCGNSKKPDDSKEVAKDINDENKDGRKAEMDANFLVEAASINLEEIELGKLAQVKGVNQQVKDLGTMMVDAHTKAINDLNSLASAKSIVIPQTTPEDGMEARKKLSEKAGADFDKEYADMMVKGHKDAIDKFEDAAKNSTDGDIKNWANTMLPELNSHLDHATAVKDMLK